jgi:uncharacterized membrane protein (DUF485 family)
MATVTVEMNEQTPLKTAESAGEGENAETTNPATEGQQTETVKVVKEKKSWFTKKNAKKPAAPTSDEATATESDAPKENNAIGEKKKCQWWKRNTCAAAEGVAKNNEPNFGINLTQRDDAGLQTAIDLGFEDIYGEPDSVHSLDNVWALNHKIFVNVKNFFYKLFALILFVPLSIVFAILFAFFSALSVFLIVPLGRLLAIPFGWVFKVWSYVIGYVLTPVFQSIGHLFGNVKVSKYGLNNDPTAVITA